MKPIIKRNRVYPEGWEDVFWPVAQRFHEHGWRTGRRRVYTLACGHFYAVPASSRQGRGQTADCTFCAQIWRWLTSENLGGVSIDHALGRLQPGVLQSLEREAQAQGRLIRPVRDTRKEVSS